MFLRRWFAVRHCWATWVLRGKGLNLGKGNSVGCQARCTVASHGAGFMAGKPFEAFAAFSP